MIFVTPEYLNQMRQHVADIQSELAQIRHEKHTSFAGDTNTWHDNFAYENLTRQEKQTEGKLFAAVADMDDCSVVLQSDVKFTGAVGIYTRVKYVAQNVNTGDEIEYTISIVPLGAADYKNKVYNYNAPMILPLMGLRAGDERTITIPTGTYDVTILGVEKYE